MVRALLIDLGLVVLFSLIGRASHGSELSLTGVLTTAWPFLVSAAAGSVVAWTGLRQRPWWLQGAVVWAITVVFGVVLRLRGGETAQPGFVIVTAVVLALFLIGWRGAAVLIDQGGRRTDDQG